MKTMRPTTVSRNLRTQDSARLRKPSVLRGSIALLAVSAASLLTSSAAHAVVYYWDTTMTGLWSDGANWSTNAAAGGPFGVVPLATDTAFFNQSSVNGPEIIQLGGATSIAGITFANTGTTQIQASAAGTQTLTVGTPSPSTRAPEQYGWQYRQSSPLTGGAQTWANNLRALLIANNVTNGRTFDDRGQRSTEISGNIGRARVASLAGDGDADLVAQYPPVTALSLRALN